MRMLVAIVAVLALAGCAGMNGPNMSVEQLNALAKDKNAYAICTQITGAGGQGVVVSVNLDKGVIATGQVTVKPNCEVLITNAAALPKVAP